jgi:hypothetical protein
MMNKNKTTRVHLLKFLFMLPLVAVILLSFRGQMNSKAPSDGGIQTSSPVLIKDTVPEVTKPNSKGFIINIKDKNGECEVVIKDKNMKEVKRILLTEWNEDEEKYKSLYGEIPPPPAVPTKELKITSANPDVQSHTIKNNIATVTLKNGKKEIYNLSISPEKNAYEKKYDIIATPAVPVEQVREVKVATTQTITSAVSVEPVIEVKFTESPVSIESKINIAEVKPVYTVTTIDAKTNVKTTSTASVKVNPVYSVTKATTVESPVNVKTAYIKESPALLNLGGLTMQNEGQYILLDGKEPGPEYNGKLTGTYRITFLDKKDAVKKYGDKGKNGAVILETIK